MADDYRPGPEWDPHADERRSQGLDELFNRGTSGESGTDYAAATPTEAVPPPPQWSLPAPTEQSVEFAVSAGYELTPAAPVTPTPHEAPIGRHDSGMSSPYGEAAGVHGAHAYVPPAHYDTGPIQPPPAHYDTGPIQPPPAHYDTGPIQPPPAPYDTGPIQPPSVFAPPPPAVQASYPEVAVNAPPPPVYSEPTYPSVAPPPPPVVAGHYDTGPIAPGLIDSGESSSWVVPGPSSDSDASAGLPRQGASSSLLEDQTQPIAGILDDLAVASPPKIAIAQPSSGPVLEAQEIRQERDTGPITPPEIPREQPSQAPPPVAVAPRASLPPATDSRTTGPIPATDLPVVASSDEYARDRGVVSDGGGVVAESAPQAPPPPPLAVARRSQEIRPLSDESGQITEGTAPPHQLEEPPASSQPKPGMPEPRTGPPAFAAEPDVRHVVLGFRDGTAVFLEPDHPMFNLFFQWSELVAGPSIPEKMYVRPRQSRMFVGRPAGLHSDR